MHTLPTDQLAALLRASAAGFYSTEAAVQLICGHRSLLRRADLRDACIQYDHDGDEPFSWIDWDAIPDFATRAPLSSSEARILRLAAELAEIDTAIPLGDLLAGLDHHNAHLALDAITHTLTHGGRR